MSAEQPPSNLAPIAAPLLLGYMFNWGLFGVLSVQVYTYNAAFKRDGRFMKGLVYGLYALEMVQTIISTNDAFITYAQNFGNPAALNMLQHIWLSVPIMTGIVSCTVQLYYAHRIHILSRSMALGLLVAVISLLQGCSAIATGVQAHQIGNFADLEAKSFLVTSLWLIGSATSDVIIAFCMVFFLVRRDTGMAATHQIISRLVRIIVETGCLTATTATVDVILFLALPGKSYHVCAALTLAKMYSNSVLVLFNSRPRNGNAQDSSRSQSSQGISRPNRPIGVGRSPQTTVLTSTQSYTNDEPWDTADSVPLDNMTNTKPRSLTESLA